MRLIDADVENERLLDFIAQACRTRTYLTLKQDRHCCLKKSSVKTAM